MAKSTPSTRGNKKKVTMKTPSKPKESKPAKSPVRSQTAEHGVEFSAKPEIVIDEETGVMSVHGIRVDNVIQLKKMSSWRIVESTPPLCIPKTTSGTRRQEI
jgi:hypothetical protein